MTTITVTLAEDRLSRLKELAARLGVTPEELVQAGVEELLARLGDSPEQVGLPAPAQARATPRGRRSIMELEGLGRELWLNIDVRDYLDRERASWDG